MATMSITTHTHTHTERDQQLERVYTSAIPRYRISRQHTYIYIQKTKGDEGDTYQCEDPDLEKQYVTKRLHSSDHTDRPASPSLS